MKSQDRMDSFAASKLCHLSNLKEEIGNIKRLAFYNSFRLLLSLEKLVSFV